jgi:hypothetical protein
VGGHSYPPAFDLYFDSELLSVAWLVSIFRVNVNGGGRGRPPPHGRLCEVEEQDFGICGAFDYQALLFAYRGAVTLVQALAV